MNFLIMKLQLICKRLDKATEKYMECWRKKFEHVFIQLL